MCEKGTIGGVGVVMSWTVAQNMLPKNLPGKPNGLESKGFDLGLNGIWKTEEQIFMVPKPSYILHYGHYGANSTIANFKERATAYFFAEDTNFRGRCVGSGMAGKSCILIQEL